MITSSHTPKHRDTVRPADSYSLAVDPYRAPRHRADDRPASRLLSDPVVVEAFQLGRAAGVA